jgi:hypothetical protein
MSGYKYSLDLVIEAMNKVVDSDPARRDAAAGEGLGGRYVRHGKPCCLVGEILVTLGASVKTLKDLDREGEQIRDSRHPFWGRFDPVARDLMASLQKKNDQGRQWGQVKWSLFRIDPYWRKANPKFAFPGPWCTDENGHVADWGDGPKF